MASFVGPLMFPQIWGRICRLWLLVAAGALIMVLVVWIMTFIENVSTFHNEMCYYLGNSQDVYDRIDGDPGAGYVAKTNIPKHLGGIVFTCAFDVAMWVLIILAGCADFFWRIPICLQLLQAFWASGMYDDRKFIDVEFFFLVANAFLKLFIVVATGSQTWVGLYPENTHVSTDLFCLYATLILACSIPFTVIALFFIIHGLKMKEYKDELKAAEEAAKKAAADKKAKEARARAKAENSG